MHVEAATRSQNANRAPLYAYAPDQSAQTIFGSIELAGARMSFAKDVEIYGEHEPADYVYKVLTGTVRVYKILQDGRRQIGAFYLQGDVFGLEAGERHGFSAEAIVDSTVRVVRRSTIVALAARDGEIKALLRDIQQHLIESRALLLRSMGRKP